jgi:hypothetical protein
MLARSLCNNFAIVVVVEEEFDDPSIPRWRAKLIAGSKVVGEGETYDCGASIVVAILSDLIANEGASFWIEVTDE